MNNAILILLLQVLANVSSTSTCSQLSNPTTTPACQAWVDSVYNSLSDAERVAQLMTVNYAPQASSREGLRTAVECNHVGGIFFSKGTAAEMAEATNYAQSISKVPLFISIDGEWGPAMRVTDAPAFPRNMGLGAIQDPTLLYNYGREVARECRALGIQIDFAPVIDVNSNPKNPVIGTRSFGEDPQRVATLGKAFSLGMESEGVMAVAKHFPGHGDTNTDSHKARPVINHSAEMLDSVDLLPFKAFIDGGCSGVMVGHLSVPSLDASGTPASMSKTIINDQLCKKMGFNGLIFTDGLGMAGAASKDNVCVRALMAGNDVLVGPTHLANDIQAVLTAVKDGRIPASEIERRCKKVLAYKYAMGLDKQPAKIDAANVGKIINSEESKTVYQQLANGMVTVVRDSSSVLPIGNLAHNNVAVVNIGADKANDFVEYCRRYTDIDSYSTKTQALSPATIEQIKKHDTVIAAVYSDSQAAISALASLRNCDNLIVVFFVKPYEMSKFKADAAHAKALVAMYSDNAYTQRAAAMGMFGGISVSGRLPVNVPGIGALGQGVDIAKSRLGYSTPLDKGLNPHLSYQIDSVVNKALRAGAFPGAQVLVAKDGDIIIDRCYGLTTKGGEKVTTGTLYDLASVSKTVGTLPGVMKAYDLGLFDLDTPAYNYVPGLNVEGKREITPRMLLHHETGMPAALNMFNVMMDTATYKGKVVANAKDRDHTIAITGGGWGHNTAKLRTDITSPTRSDKYPTEIAKGIYAGKHTYDTIMANIYRAKIKPDRKYVYSCLNFCLLMDMEQRLTGIAHDQWVTDSIWAPLGASTFCYQPVGKYPLSRIAATEQDTYLRKQHVHGYVHDELADFSGGVQGNAGVFGTATDIAKLCQMWLNGGTYGDARILSDATTTLFTTDKSKTCRRGLGFDKPDTKNKDNSPTCDEASAATYGHTGFTGTCFWVDPDSQLIFIFLSNRVDPSRSNKAFSQSSIRPTLMSLVYSAMGK